MEAHLGELNLPSRANEEEPGDAGRIIAARHIQIGVQENREAHAITLHQLPRFRGAVLRDSDHPVSVVAERLRQSLEIGDREAARGAVDFDEGEQERSSVPRHV